MNKSLFKRPYRLKYLQTIFHNNYFQTLTNGDNQTPNYKKIFLAATGIYGGILTLLEIAFYIIIYFYLIIINKNVGAKVLNVSVINERNRKNAITLSGQVATCFIELWYFILIPVLSNFLDIEFLREIAPIIKHFDVLIVPLVQIYTSPPLKAFMVNR